MPTGGKTPNYVQQRRYAARLQHKRDQYRAELSSINRIADALEGTQNQEQADDDSRALREKITIGLLIFTVIFTGLLDWISYVALQDSRETAKEQFRRLDHQLDLMDKGSRQTDIQIDVNRDLAQAAKDQATAARDSITAAHDNIVADSRAWVGPNGATIAGAPVAGNAVNLLMTYQNTGRQPATGFISDVKFSVITTEEDKGGVTATTIRRNLIECSVKQPIEGVQIVYPTNGFTAENIAVTIDKSMIDDKVVSGDKIILLTGCFAYLTFNTPHHSAFCFFYKAGKTIVPNLNFCAQGADAN